MYLSMDNFKRHKIISGLRLTLKDLARPGALFIIFTAFILVTSTLLFAEPVGSNDLNSLKSDLDGDGIKEEYIIYNHCLIIREETQELWRSPADWSVDNAVLGDVDNDGKMNLVITLWKTGSYGPVKPFWQNGKDNEYKNHLFVYSLDNNRLKEVWCSSNLDHPIVSFEIKDINADGLNELLVVEGEYRKFMGDLYVLDRKNPNQRTVWNWDEWGFSLNPLKGI